MIRFAVLVAILGLAALPSPAEAPKERKGLPMDVKISGTLEIRIMLGVCPCCLAKGRN
jgi:hypothetical protein